MHTETVRFKQFQSNIIQHDNAFAKFFITNFYNPLFSQIPFYEIKEWKFYDANFLFLFFIILHFIDNHFTSDQLAS